MRHAKKGFFPLDKYWGLTGMVYSREMARQVVWLSGLLPYEQVSQVLERLGFYGVPQASIWRQSQYYGQRMKAHVEHQQDLVSVERVKLPMPWEDHNQQKGISLDGGMVHIRDEGWKEMKVGTIFDVQKRLERDQKTGELVEQPHALHQGYVAVLGSAEQFAPAFWGLAVEHEVPQAATSSVTADGASWIWNVAADLFPDSAQIVDWYHASQHLSEASHALFPEDAPRAKSWFDRHKTHLFQGEIHRITEPLDNAELADHSHYFHTHKRRMHYQRFQAEGFPIGSGTVESSIKQFKHRLSGPGMRWSRPGAEQMLVIRSAVLSENFDALWSQVA